MKIGELDFFEVDIRKEFCAYLEQYFKEKCKAEWTSARSILLECTFEGGKKTLDNRMIIIPKRNCKIYLYGLSKNINLSKFAKYVDAFLDREYTPKKYIKDKDMRQILSLYNKLKIAFKKDDIEDFYNAIQRAIFLKKQYYLFDTFIKKVVDKSDCPFYKAEAVQEINDISGAVDFKTTIKTEAGVKYACVFSVDYDKLNILDIARKLTQLQLKLERVI